MCDVSLWSSSQHSLLVHAVDLSLINVPGSESLELHSCCEDVLLLEACWLQENVLGLLESLESLLFGVCVEFCDELSSDILVLAQLLIGSLNSFALGYGLDRRLHGSDDGDTETLHRVSVQEDLLHVIFSFNVHVFNLS